MSDSATIVVTQAIAFTFPEFSIVSAEVEERVLEVKVRSDETVPSDVDYQIRIDLGGWTTVAPNGDTLMANVHTLSVGTHVVYVKMVRGSSLSSHVSATFEIPSEDDVPNETTPGWLDDWLAAMAIGLFILVLVIIIASVFMLRSRRKNKPGMNGDGSLYVNEGQGVAPSVDGGITDGTMQPQSAILGSNGAPQNGTGTPQSQAVPSRYERLEELKSLHERGLISEDEYATAKERIIQEML